MKASSYGWKGVAAREFFQFLPGVYWLNVFGAELAVAFDDVDLTALPEATAVSLKRGGVLVRLKEALRANNLERRSAIEDEIARRMGPEHVFDKQRPEATPSHRPRFGEWLATLDDTNGPT